MTTRHYPVEVTWRDACSHESGWMTVKAIPKRLMDGQSYSCGYLIRKTRHDVVLAMNYNGKDLYADFMAIPRSQVLSIKRCKA